MFLSKILHKLLPLFLVITTIFCRRPRFILSDTKRGIDSPTENLRSCAANAARIGHLPNRCHPFTQVVLLYLHQHEPADKYAPSNHSEVFQRIPDGGFLFGRHLKLGSALWRWQVIVRSHIQSAFSLNLGDIQAGDFQPMVLQDVFLDFRIGGFGFSSGQI